MKKRVVLLAVVTMFFVSVSSARSADNVIDTVAKGCEKELTSYCKDVTPGEGRLLACLYAHQDKVSAKCVYALIDAAIQLDRAISALTYFANVCEEDLEKHCMEVELGEGRVIDCLSKQKEN